MSISREYSFDDYPLRNVLCRDKCHPCGTLGEGVVIFACS